MAATTIRDDPRMEPPLRTVGAAVETTPEVRP